MGLGDKEIKADISPLHILFYQQLFPHSTPINKTFVELLNFVFFTSLFIHFPKDIIMYHSVWLRWKRICRQCRDPGSIPGWGRPSGEGNGYPLQYSCLGNYTDRRVWWATVHVVAKSQTCLTLCHPMNYSPPGSSVCGILQATVLNWVAIPFSRSSSQPREGTQVTCTCIHKI